MSQNIPPKISIVTANLNAAPFLEKTILSVLANNYSNLEYSIIDGGSTDGSLAIIEKHQHNLTRWESKKDNGLYDALKTSLDVSTGEIMGWINSDDYYLPWTLKTVANVFSNFPDIEWITTLNPGLIDSDDFPMSFSEVSGYSRESMLDGRHLPSTPHGRAWSIQQESTFWRRKLWNRVGGLDLSYKWAGDFDLWTRFFDSANLYAISSPLSCFRIRLGQMSTNSRYLEEARVALERMRTRSEYRKKWVRDGFWRLNAGKIPKFGRLITQAAGYHGLTLVRKNPHNGSAGWLFRDKYFL
jgi:glycosyltransferase involved in cell wall biosynthesis